MKYRCLWAKFSSMFLSRVVPYECRPWPRDGYSEVMDISFVSGWALDYFRYTSSAKIISSVVRCNRIKGYACA